MNLFLVLFLDTLSLFGGRIACQAESYLAVASIFNCPTDILIADRSKYIQQQLFFFFYVRSERIILKYRKDY